jgi:hypothetical protein
MPYSATVQRPASGDLRIGAAMTWSTDEYRKTSRRLRTEAGYAAKQYSAILSDRKSLQA